MNTDIKMSVSAITRKGYEKAVYIVFQDGDKMAEFALPECRVVGNFGFDEKEIEKLREYVDGERDSIYSMAKQINPIKALMRE